MTLQAVKERHPNIDMQTHPSDLLRDLVAQISHNLPSHDLKVLHRTEDTVDEIIYEVDIEGVHYSIVRRRSFRNSHISLSPRELAIAELIAKGMSNKCIAEILDISPWTVATHLRRIFSKLGVTSRAAMAVRLLEEDFL
jgi:DNA-binding CsgD family transcriptional regulator